MTAKVIELDSKRRRITEWLHCLFCERIHWSERIEGQPYAKCPGCDEQASIPEWQWRYGR